MKLLPSLLLTLAACAPRVEVTLFSITGENDPILSRVDFVIRAGDRTATASEQDIQLPRIETIALPEGFDEESITIEAIAFIDDREVGRSAVNLAPGQPEANLFFSVCSNKTSEAKELCDDGNLVDADGCDSSCKPTGCNSDVLTAGEICFAEQNPVVANAAPLKVLLEDMNGDQLLDLVALYPPESKTRIFFANENNVFGNFVEVDLNLNFDANRFAVADLNQDGFLDLVGGNTTISATFLNQGNSTFKGGQRSLVEADLRDLALADLDGDQIPEKIELDFQQNRVRTLKSIGDGTFDLSPTNTVTVDIQPFALSVADIDQDGDNDVITANLSGSVSVVLNNVGIFTVTNPIIVNGTPTVLTTADFDGDGLLDIAITKQSGGSLVSIFTQVATEPIDFQEAGDFAAPTNAKGLIAADVDLDGDSDIAITSESEATVTIFVNNGGGQFAPVEPPIPTTEGPKAIAAGDINRDGLLDFVTAGQDLGLIFSNP